jgi:RNA polymerase sigma factor (sigma-70 family)
MPTSRVSEVMEYLRRTVILPDGAAMTDGQLLSRFVEGRDEDAFAALVRRHGPMVWGVCRRLLPNHHDAEDAFQATFLVLVRKAATVLPREMVANWLYGVAYMTAQRGRATAAKARRRERQMAEMPEPAVAEPDLWEDLRAVLDQELTRLPDQYRVVVVLCDLEGKTRKEVARQLGLPEGTVASRLARARAMLAKRLVRHGLMVSGGPLSAFLSEEAASASLPGSVMASPIKAVTSVAAGQAAATALVSAKVAALTEGVIKGMLLKKLKIAVALMVVLAITGLGVGRAILPTQAAEPPKEYQANEKPQAPKALDAQDKPQAVYAANHDDPWNRIFYCLFTRTIKARLSDDFGEGQRVVERIEYGDRAIEPISPSPTGGWTTYQDGAYRVMTEPLYSRFKKALEDTLNYRRQRPPLARALMQADVWAAHDILSRNYDFYSEGGKKRLDRRNELVGLLAQLVKKVALTPKEIKALPDNYAAAIAVHRLPDLFGADSGWWEVRWSKERIHDSAADYRRVARVFIKPASSPKDRLQFLNGMRLGSEKPSKPSKQLEAVALVTQNLLIDSDGKAVVSPLTYEVQVRTFVKDKDGKLVRTESKQYELNRQKLLHDPKGGGFVEADDKVAVYLPNAGNDYSFASHPHRGDAEPIMVRLGTRCTACHGSAEVFTFNRDVEPDESGALPPVTLLKPSDNEHARYVIGRKAERKEFTALQERWKDR